jgi:hypothetical protein
VLKVAPSNKGLPVFNKRHAGFQHQKHIEVCIHIHRTVCNMLVVSFLDYFEKKIIITRITTGDCVGLR